MGPPKMSLRSSRKGEMIRCETLIELKYLNSSFWAYPLIEIRQTAPCRAIRGSSISVSSALPPLREATPPLSGVLRHVEPSTLSFSFLVISFWNTAHRVSLSPKKQKREKPAPPVIVDRVKTRHYVISYDSLVCRSTVQYSTVNYNSMILYIILYTKLISKAAPPVIVDRVKTPIITINSITSTTVLTISSITISYFLLLLIILLLLVVLFLQSSWTAWRPGSASTSRRRGGVIIPLRTLRQIVVLRIFKFGVWAKLILKRRRWIFLVHRLIS